MTLSHIVACSKNHVIGNGGDLPWHIPEDFKFFKEKTKGHILIMGRKTFESLPGSKPLPNRYHIVITRSYDYAAEGAHIVSSIDDAIKFAGERVGDYPEEIFIIGGGEIYRQTVNLVDTIYLTRINKDFEGDTVYPLVPEDFKLVEESKREEPVSFSFLTYKK